MDGKETRSNSARYSPASSDSMPRRSLAAKSRRHRTCTRMVSSGACRRATIFKAAIVYGVETDFSYARVRGTALNVSNGLLNPVITTAQDSNLHWLGTLRGRLGVLPTPVSLFYVTGGLAYGHTAASTTTTVPTVTFPTVPPSVSRCPDLNLFCSTGSSSKTRAGWTIGGGLEYAFGQNWSAKLEYLYYDLGRESYLTVTQAALAPTPVMQADAKFAGHIARVGINYRFGGPVVARY